MSNVAILYSGQPRDFIECWPNHQKYIMSSFCVGTTVAVFAHLWNYNLKIEEFIIDVVDPTIVDFEDSKIFSHPSIISDPRYYHPLNNIVSQAYSLYQASLLMDKYVQDVGNEKFNFVIRTRTDNWFTEPLGKLSDYDSKGLHITDIQSHTDYALGDTFAFGDYDTMMSYCRMYPDFEDICDEGAVVNPECILGWNVKRNNLIVHKHPFYPKLYRDVV